MGKMDGMGRKKRDKGIKGIVLILRTSSLRRIDAAAVANRRRI